MGNLGSDPRPLLNDKALKINKVYLLIMLHEMKVTSTLQKTPNTK
jgi:hypothetical protein